MSVSLHSGEPDFPQLLTALHHHLAEPDQVVELMSGPEVGVLQFHPLHIPIQALSKDGRVVMASVSIFDVKEVHTFNGS